MAQLPCSSDVYVKKKNDHVLVAEVQIHLRKSPDNSAWLAAKFISTSKPLNGSIGSLQSK